VLRLGILDEFDHSIGPARVVGGPAHGLRALGMGEYQHIGELPARIADIRHRKALVHFAGTVPADKAGINRVKRESFLGALWEYNIFPHRARGVGRQVAVRNENDPLAVQRFNDGAGVAGSAANVRFRLHIGIGVYIRHHRRVGKLAAYFPHIIGGNAFSQGAARFFSRKKNGLVRAQNLGGLCHEADSAENNDILVRGGGLAAQIKRIACEIGDAVEQSRLHVVVRKDDGIALLFEFDNFFGDFGFVAQFDIRHHAREFSLQFFIHSACRHGNSLSLIKAPKMA